MKGCNFYLSREDAEIINEEVEFISGKTGLAEYQAVELIKIKLLSDILNHLEKKERRKNGDM